MTTSKNQETGDGWMADTGLDGRVALITGANHGIGAAITRALAANGVKVLATYLRMDATEFADDPGTPDQYGIERARPGAEVVDAITANGGTAIAVERDLAAFGSGDNAGPGELFDHAERELGPVEILVLNASSWLANTFLPQTTDRFGRRLTPVSAASHDKMFSVDARANASLIAELAARHVARDASWGRILALTSAGSNGFPDEVSYGAAKAALESYVKSAAWELGRHGITANLIYPPATDTGWVTPVVEKAVREQSPLRHVGQPDEVAEVAVWLVSHQARYVTGNVIQMH